ncbi:hypothetical protein KM043_002284 [Ampulex compressa]|nr:hypothetical protein KM043_002284 [Ampulex compressa]
MGVQHRVRDVVREADRDMSVLNSVRHIPLYQPYRASGKLKITPLEEQRKISGFWAAERHWKLPKESLEARKAAG